MKDNKNYVYLDGSQPLAIYHSLILQTDKKLIIFNLHDETIFSKSGTVEQVYSYGNYFVMRDIYNLSGVLRYDGLVVVPFEFYAIFLCDGIINVKKDENSDFEQYGELPL